MKKDSLGDRMKGYENVSRIYLPRRMPLIIRLDGRAFHTFTRGFDRPYDKHLTSIMQYTAKELCENISGARLAYTQSDEISILITDYDDISTEPWFGKNLQKICSISASMCTLFFNRMFRELLKGIRNNKIDQAMFDCRAFIVPKEDVYNYFLWRQKDAERNSIQMLAQANYSHKELQGKNTAALHDLLMGKGINWNDVSVANKRGACIHKKWVEELERWKFGIDFETPLFSDDPEYISRWV